MTGIWFLGGAQPATDRQPVLAGHHQVEHDQVVRSRRARSIIGAIADGLHRELVFGQVAVGQLAQARRHPPRVLRIAVFWFMYGMLA